jgi:hypothetical protein
MTTLSCHCEPKAKQSHFSAVLSELVKTYLTVHYFEKGMIFMSKWFLILVLNVVWVETTSSSEVIFYSRQVRSERQTALKELSQKYYQIESIDVANHQLIPDAKPQIVFSFKDNQRGVSDYGSILNLRVHPQKKLILFTSDHDQERSLFKTNAFMIDPSGKNYLQLSPYRSNGRWQQKQTDTGTVTGRVIGPIAPESGAIVFIEGVNEPVTTDFEGNFVIEKAPAGINRHIVAWKMSLIDVEVIQRYQNDYNFGSNSVTVAPNTTSTVDIILTYKGFGYGWGETTRSYLEYCSWAPDDAVYAVFGENSIYQLYPTFGQVKDMGRSVKSIDYHSGTKQWAVMFSSEIVITDAQFNNGRVILTNDHLHQLLNNNAVNIGSIGLNNSCICWSPNGQQVMFEIYMGKSVMVYDFITNLFYIAAWPNDNVAEYRIGSFSPDSEFALITLEYRPELQRPTELWAVRWKDLQEAYLIASNDGIQRGYWTELDKNIDYWSKLFKAELKGDVNQDGVIDIGDFAIVGLHFGETPPIDNSADVNGDETVDISDLMIVGEHFGESVQSASNIRP